MQPLFLPSSCNLRYQTKESEASALDKVWEIAKKVIFYLAAGVFFATTPIFFTPGFLFGFFESKKIQKDIDKINLFWKTQPRKTLLIMGVGAFLSLPITWGAASFFTGAYSGSKLYCNARAIKNKHLSIF